MLVVFTYLHYFFHYTYHAWVSAIMFCEAYNEAERQHDMWKGNVCREKWRLHHDALSASIDSKPIIIKVHVYIACIPTVHVRKVSFMNHVRSSKVDI